MFDFNLIKKSLIQRIEKGERNFVLYPFGMNGMEVKRCLEECFGITPRLIVDNNLSKYNSKIIDFERLKQEIREDDCIVLTVENDIVNGELEKKLKELGQGKEIINLYREDTVWGRKRTLQKGCFSLGNILPALEPTIEPNVKRNKNKRDAKIKIRFLHPHADCWNSMATICEAFKKDSRYDVKILINAEEWRAAKYLNETASQMERNGYEYELQDEYQVEEDKPDIFVITATQRHLYEICNYAKMIVVQPLTLIHYETTMDKCVQNLEKAYGELNPDFYLFDSLLYHDLSQYGFKPGKLIEMGNAKYDRIYFASLKKKFLPGWEKLQGRRIVLWTTTHGILDNVNWNEVSFDRYAMHILQYAKEHQDMGVIFRPNPRLIMELLEYGHWTEKDYETFMEYCRKSPNIVFDNTEGYEAAYSVADAILTDANCGIICSALPLMKPICITYCGDGNEDFQKKLVENYYSAYCKEELIDFLNMVREGKDPMYEKRKEISRKYVKNFDGKNGERIKQFIDERYKEMIE